jgi:hypothetical protein
LSGGAAMVLPKSLTCLIHFHPLHAACPQAS